MSLRRILTSLTAGVAALQLGASDAYLPAPQSGNLVSLVSLQWAEDFRFGNTPATLPGHLTQTTLAFEAEYGVRENVAVDFSSGFSFVNYQGQDLGGVVLITDGQETRDGLADSRLGISWRVVDEFTSFEEATPTITLRMGAIIAGTYDTGFINAVGDGASGVEAGVKFGKVIFPHNAGIYGDFTYRWLNRSVPDEWEASIGGFKNIENFTLFLGLREKHAVDGIDILGPGFTLARFPEVQEINRTLEAGLAWAPTEHTRFSIGYARTLEGKNTPKKNVFVFSCVMNL